ncbi:hypothetical protein SAMN04488494_2640 [Xylanibacter ruminicola]|uniref:Uncharacterized protein n=1 Tax=Xylanibacter ruminicola TaxID=839 RepID=A0A1M7LP28_XYLRU|nr:hypothetical protein [Xylanibacter ruminicola]SFC32036.1 hypothetical protein SAMN04488493_10599 [Xylanibacter ruminicola]SHM79841.1 hypothetical protein SAMN04488494_2640 [Xylanibacter ruminicola]
MIQDGVFYQTMAALRSECENHCDIKNSEIQVALFNNIIYFGCNSGGAGKNIATPSLFKKFKIKDLPGYNDGKVKTPKDKLEMVNEWIRNFVKDVPPELSNINDVVFCKPSDTFPMHAEMNIIGYLHSKNVELNGVMYLVGKKTACRCCRKIIDTINELYNNNSDKSHCFQIEVPCENLFKESQRKDPAKWTNPFVIWEGKGFCPDMVKELKKISL